MPAEERALSGMECLLSEFAMRMFFSEPTLEEILSDPIIIAVMHADGVDRDDLERMLGKLRTPGKAWHFDRVPTGVAHKENCISAQ